MPVFGLPAVWIVDRFPGFFSRSFAGSGNDLKDELLLLSGGRKEAVREYEIAKCRELLILLGISALILGAVLVRSVFETGEVKGERISRPGYGQEDEDKELEASASPRKKSGTRETRTLTVTVGNREYSAKEAEVLLKQAQEELEQVFLGENTSQDEIRKAMYFPETLQQGSVKAEWTLIPYGVIGTDGSIREEIWETEQEEEGTEGIVVELQVELSCQNEKRIFETAVRVLPPLMTEQERFWKDVGLALRKADADTVTEEELRLPRSVDDRTLTWRYPQEDKTAVFLLVMLVLPVFLCFHRDRQVHEKALDRNRQLAMDYPDLMWKMAMLLGAGMTIRNSFFRIAAQYSREKQGKKEKRYVYEEILYTCNEMRSGIPETTACENFGKRCGTQRYVKLGTYLSQNLQKGARGLTAFLESEAADSMEERKNLSRKMGEQAGTKLLFPMILMLGVVMTILMVPAFLSI